jgi:hypothetical protein
LATLVSQDPTYVIFTSNRTRLDLRDRYASKGGYSAVVIKLRLPNGDIYESDGKLDYVSPNFGGSPRRRGNQPPRGRHAGLRRHACRERHRNIRDSDALRCMRKWLHGFKRTPNPRRADIG